jgi:hypothetical protein
MINSQILGSAIREARLDDPIILAITGPTGVMADAVPGAWS